MPTLLNASAPDPLSPSNIDTSAEQAYILVISINPGAPLGGSASQYFPGSFNGTTFTPFDSAARLLDFGKDNYAGQFFYNRPTSGPAANLPISMAWASNWQYAQTVPTGLLENFRSAFSVPRVSALAKDVGRIGYDLITLPVDISGLYTNNSQPLLSNPNLQNGTIVLPYGQSVPSLALNFSLTVSNISTNGSFTAGTVNMTFLSSSNPSQYLRMGYFLGGDSPFFVDRGGVLGYNTNPFFTDKFSSNYPIIPASSDPSATSGSFKLEGIIDRSVLEIFLDGGKRNAIVSFFTAEGDEASDTTSMGMGVGQGGLDVLVVKAGGLNEGVGVSVDVWGLNSVWGSDSANVKGNVTTQMVRRDWS